MYKGGFFVVCWYVVDIYYVRDIKKVQVVAQSFASFLCAEEDWVIVHRGGGLFLKGE